MLRFFSLNIQLSKTVTILWQSRSNYTVDTDQAITQQKPYTSLLNQITTLFKLRGTAGARLKIV